MVRFNVEENITDEKTLVCCFSEQLDTDNCMKIEDELLKKVCDAKMAVVFDLEAVNYVSSAFLRICLRVLKEVGEKNLSIVNVRSDVKKVFKIAGFDKQINIA